MNTESNATKTFASLADAWLFCREAYNRGDLTSEPLQVAPYTVRVLETAEQRAGTAAPRDGLRRAHVVVSRVLRTGVLLTADEADEWLAIHAPRWVVDRDDDGVYQHTSKRTEEIEKRWHLVMPAI